MLFSKTSRCAMLLSKTNRRAMLLSKTSKCAMLLALSRCKTSRYAIGVVVKIINEVRSRACFSQSRRIVGKFVG